MAKGIPHIFLTMRSSGLVFNGDIPVAFLKVRCIQTLHMCAYPEALEVARLQQVPQVQDLPDWPLLLLRHCSQGNRPPTTPKTQSDTSRAHQPAEMAPKGYVSLVNHALAESEVGVWQVGQRLQQNL